MASFTIYDPRTKTFRALETAPESDLPFEQVLLINILIELRVLSRYLNDEANPSGRDDDVEEVRAAIVQEIG